MRRATLFTAAFIMLYGCDDDPSRPPPIDRIDCPRSSVVGGSAPGCPTYDGGSSSGDGASSDESSTGAPVPTCEDFQACAIECSLITFGDSTLDVRYHCAAQCAAPDIYASFLTEWGQACATADMADEFPDAVSLCDDGLGVCEQLQQQDDER